MKLAKGGLYLSNKKWEIYIILVSFILDFWVVSFKTSIDRGAWVAQSVERPTAAQVTISRSVSSSPALVCVTTAHSLEPASDCVPPSLSAPPLLMLSLSHSQK